MSFCISFCIQTIERVSLGSYKIGAILLTGLFFYDIFWVFGTEVMVTVAKSFDGPIKLLFRRSFETVVDGVTKKAEFSLLGLGDIVVPGKVSSTHMYIFMSVYMNVHLTYQHFPMTQAYSLLS